MTIIAIELSLHRVEIAPEIRSFREPFFNENVMNPWQHPAGTSARLSLEIVDILLRFRSPSPFYSFSSYSIILCSIISRLFSHILHISANIILVLLLTYEEVNDNVTRFHYVNE